MTTCNLKTKIIMRNDTPQNWANNNPILGKGEIGCAIDDTTGIVTLKIGDGVHHWCDLEMRPGVKESKLSQTLSSNDYKQFYQANTQASLEEFSQAMQKIQKAASSAGVSIAEASAALSNIYKMGGSVEKPVKLVVKEEDQRSSTETLLKMAQALKEEKMKEQPQKSLFEEFDIPHYEIETADIEYSIDL